MARNRRTTRTDTRMVWVVLLVLALGLVGCTDSTESGADSAQGSEPGTAPTSGGGGSGSGGGSTLRTAYQADIDTFDPDNGFEVAGLGAINAVYEGLVEYEQGSTEVVGLLADSWEVSDDGLTYTFRLRDGVVFHDGTPMTSEEVKNSLERRRDGELALSYFLGNFASIETPDEQTVTVTLNEPQPSFIDDLASPWGPKIISPEALAQDDAGEFLTENAVGTGPFTLATFDRGRQYVLERFDDYWGEPANFATVDIAIVPDIGQQVLQLQNGELDVVLHGYPFEQMDSLPEGLEASSYNDLGLEMAYVNTFGALSDADLRTSVAAAAAPEGWIADAFSGRAQPALSLYPREMLTPEEPFTFPEPSADVATDAPIEIVYTQGEEAVQRRVADLLIAQLANAGIQATARAVPQDELFTYAEDPAGAPDLVLAQNNPDSAHPATQAGLFFAGGAPLNLFGYASEEADALFAEAATVTDEAARDEMYVEGARLIFEDEAFLPLADVEDVVVHRAGLTDLGFRPAIPWNVDLATIQEG